MRLAVIMAMALAALAATDSASAAGRHAQQASSKGVAGGSLTSKKLVSPKATQPATKGIIMRDGGVCDPIRHMGC